MASKASISTILISNSTLISLYSSGDSRKYVTNTPVPSAAAGLLCIIAPFLAERAHFVLVFDQLTGISR